MRHVALRSVVLLAAIACAAGRAGADELLPADRPIEDVVDFYIDAKLERESVSAAPAADDENFVRRVTLDLAGRIPTIGELSAYLESTDADRKSRLVDRLLASPDFAYHQRNELDLLLSIQRESAEWHGWLLKVSQEHRSWPEIFRALMLARESDPDEKPAAEFLKWRSRNIDDLTNDTSRIFFGVNISCAKCHDHPLVADWTQDHYFGLASFFNRTYVTKKRFLAERDDGVLKFRTTAGEEKQASLMFLNGTVLPETTSADWTDEQKQAIEEKEKADAGRETPPDPPRFSRRERLVDVALAPGADEFFSRAFANRAWARFMGTGLVTPLDQMHSENEPSHPELLAWLAGDARRHDYDLRRLIRGLVLSRTYGRSSRWEQSGLRPAAQLFATAGIRALTPRQLALSLSLATANPHDASAGDSPSNDWSRRRGDLESATGDFSKKLEVPGENFQIGVGEALLFSNSDAVETSFLRDSNDSLLGLLKTTGDRTQAIQTAYLAVLSRPPSAEEIVALTDYLEARHDRPVEALKQMLWSLLTSSEFRFNY